jgi:hypothetical protein
LLQERSRKLNASRDRKRGNSTYPISQDRLDAKAERLVVAINRRSKLPLRSWGTLICRFVASASPSHGLSPTAESLDKTLPHPVLRTIRVIKLPKHFL